jgi:prephenate dehydratase/prephenate dehydrogenase
MGAAFASFFGAQGYEVLISDRRTKLTNKDIARKADIVIVAVPIDRTEEIISEIAPLVRKSALLMDITSVKELPVRAMMKSKASVIGLHPMCNETTFGPGQTLLYCPKRPGKWGKWFKETFEKKGGLKLIKTTPRKHDEQMAVVQALIHFTEFVLGETLRQLDVKIGDLMTYASPASQLQLKIAARHLAQDPNLYGNIQLKNPRTPHIIQTYANAVGDLWKIIEAEDLKAFEQYFKRGTKFFGDFGVKAFKETDHFIGDMITPPHQQAPEFPKNSVATLGPAFTHTSLAAEAMANGRSVVLLSTVHDIVEAVDKGKVKHAIIPLENRLHGTVRETLDALFEFDVKIVGESIRPIHHHLAIPDGAKRADITKVMSHNQALHQCSDYLRKQFPKAQWQSVESTAAAFKNADLRTAVIGTEEAAQHFDFKILKKNIENDRSNTTTFIEIGKRSPRKPKGKAKTSIVFYFGKDKPGSLLQVFQIFGDHKINLTRIESRPAPKKLGQYLFYIDFEESPNSARALRKISKLAGGFKQLGTY